MFKKAKAVQEVLRNYQNHIDVIDGEPKASKELQAAICYSILFVDAMDTAIDQIKQEVEYAASMEDYIDKALGYRSDYGDDAFSGISRAEDILDAAVASMHFRDVMESIMRNG